MFEFISGLIVGAVFAPMWMKVYNFITAKVTEFLSK